MFFRKKNQPVEDPNNSLAIDRTVPSLQEIINSRDREIPIEKLDVKRTAFYAAIQNKTLIELMTELEKWYEKQKNAIDQNISQRIAYILEHVNLLNEKIQIEESYLENAQQIKSELENERSKFIEDVEKLTETFKSLIEDLGNAHKNLIENRLKEIQSELDSIVNLYNSVFENKYKDEHELKIAVSKQRELCEELITSNKNKLAAASESLEKEYRFGVTKLAAQFKIMIGVVATLGAGWFFSIFSDLNELESQNWIFYMISNSFNYLNLYITKFGPFYGSIVMVLGLMAILIVVSIVVFVSQSFIHKMTNDKFDSEFGFNINASPKRFFKVRANSSSLISLWFQLVPWIFGFGLVFIFLAVGQSNGGELDQINELRQRISSQFIGGIIALLYAGLYFIYQIQVLEPRKLRKLENPTPKSEKKTNWELFGLIILVNGLLCLIAFRQSFKGALLDNKALLAIGCFIVLANLSAFILSSGIRQIGLFKLVAQSEANIIKLSNYRKALAGNKPIQVWIQEENQFRKAFISIQQELLQLIRLKNQSLLKLKKKNVLDWFHFGDNRMSKIDFIDVGRLNLSRKKEAQFYMLNFPDLAYKIEETRNQLNNKKRDLDAITTKIEQLRDGHSDFHITINNKIASLRRSYEYLQRQHVDLMTEKINQDEIIYQTKCLNEAQIIEGFQLGEWTKLTLIKPDYGNTI